MPTARSASRVQKAVYEYVQNTDLTLTGAARAHDLKPSTFARIFKNWRQRNQNVQLGCPSDVTVPIRRRGRPRLLTSVEEDTLAKVALRYSDNGWPLTVTLVQDLAFHYVQEYCSEETQSRFKGQKPSRGWAVGFIRRRDDLRMIAMQVIEEQRVAAITPSVVAEHIARVRAVFQRYGIKSAAQVVNLDETGISFDRMTGRGINRGVTHARQKTAVVSTALRTKGGLNHVTVMAVVSANGTAFKPVVVFPGKQAHFRRLASGHIQTVKDFLPPCYLFQRDPAGVDKHIFLAWSHEFVAETEHIRSGGRYMAIIMDSFSGHVQSEVLSYLFANRIVVLALPSHSSHRLQPLDVSVFAAYKSAVKSELHRTSRHARCIDVFAAADCVATAYTASLTYTNIVRGFEHTGLWVRSIGGPSLEPLRKLFRKDGKIPTVKELMDSFDKCTRRLVFGTDVVQGGTVQVDTSTGAHLTSGAVLNALRERDERRAGTYISPFKRRAIAKRRRKELEDVDKSLAPERRAQRAFLDRSRSERLAARKRNARTQRLGDVAMDDPNN